ncbi:hypothetical protein [Amycolatopsis sp. PS_44_ISF1]|uniref:hypothetical protein n=1 Tax=Amycolatopsis sp. PS_44_ISF1 TaxID=2974917 RepID=UPI0028E00BB9|nr:hypothetical protein [Amycolatopsis sp. PS_44_ISF1]MDT8915221.1 hypothetical protein [Amycolatopsis sp. PS_44_ISF1]
MTAGTRSRPAAPDAHLRELPPWLTAEADVAGRMVTLSYRVACSTGRSRRESKRLLDRLLPALAEAGRPRPVGEWTDPGRRARARLVKALRAELTPEVDRAVLAAALRDAVLLDELALLPPRQRFALWATAVARRSTDDLIAVTGWTPRQVSKLLQAALRTVALHARP